MKWDFAVSFEHPTSAVKTLRGRVEGSVGPAARRAINAAREQVEGKLYFSSVVVVLEKAQNDEEELELSTSDASEEND